MKKKREKSKITFQEIYNPYKGAGKSLNEWTEAYKNDKSAVVDIDGLVYYRAVLIDLFDRDGKLRLCVFIDSKIKVRINDILIDDNDNQYTVEGFPMFRLTEDANWYKTISCMMLFGNFENIGHYFAKLPVQKESSEE